VDFEASIPVILLAVLAFFILARKILDKRSARLERP
jgi:hypothetical protein